TTNTKLLDVLKTDDPFQDSIQTDFLRMVRRLREAGRDIKIMCFFEALPLPNVGKVVVSKGSATLDGYERGSIHADHGNMVRFATTEENGFKRFLAELEKCLPRPGKNHIFR
ncbi:hypothetical protein PHISCL_10634, partial [Aspergillus sclerotialis]